MLEYLTIGTIINVHGVVGEVKVSPLTDDIKRFKKLKSVIICPAEDKSSGGALSLVKKEEPREVKVLGAKLQSRFAILKLEGITDRDMADKLRGYELKVARKDAVALPEDTYFIGDLCGCTVFEEDGTVLGKIDDVFSTGGSDVYSIIDDKKRNIMLPALKETILLVDIENQKVVVKLLPGLKEIYFG